MVQFLIASPLVSAQVPRTLGKASSLAFTAMENQTEEKTGKETGLACDDKGRTLGKRKNYRSLHSNKDTRPRKHSAKCLISGPWEIFHT